MPVLGQAADERFIDFGLTSYAVEVTELHREADAVFHEPRASLLHADRATQLVAADAVLRVADEPDSGEPVLQLDGRVLENRADLHRELGFGVSALALPEPTRRNVPYVL